MLKIDERFWKEIRCAHCRRLLAMEYIFSGRIMIKCKCGEMTTVEYKTPTKYIKHQVPENEMILNRTENLKGGERT